MTTLKLSRIDAGVETILWQGDNEGLNPADLRCGWKTMFKANVDAASPVPPPLPAISIADATASGDTATFTITLDKASTAPVVVGFATADLLAKAGEDYEHTVGTVGFDPGVTSKTVTVPILPNAVEPDETFKVNLVSPSGATIARSSATGTILGNQSTGGTVGPMGPQGPMGPPGPVGPAGPQGPAGTGSAGSTTINVTGGSLPKPTTTADVQALLNAAASNDTFVMFDPTTKVDITAPLTLQCKGNAGQPWGILGNGAKLIWKGPAGGKLLTVKGAVADWGAFRSNRGLLIEKLFLDGQATSGDLLTLEALYGDPGSIYKSVLRDVYTVYSGANGITLRGAVFESYGDNLHAENCLGHGMETMHDQTDRGGGRGIISNINIIHPNFSRNKGAGMKCTYSTNVTFGSFVLNAEGGVLAPNGLRYAAGNNGENTGEALFVVPGNDYGSLLVGNEVSSDGSTHHRQFEGGQWVSYGKPCLYLLAGLASVIERDGHCSYYGSASTSPMRIRK
jgi:hypothetical protein